VKRRSDRCIEISDRYDLEGLMSNEGGMEAALESDGFVVTGVSMSFEIGASVIQMHECPRALMENDPTLPYVLPAHRNTNKTQ
jgi:hypothetical protein